MKKKINQIIFSFVCVECCEHSIFRNNNFYNLIFLLFFYRSRFDQLWVKLNGGSASVRLELLCSPFWFIRKGKRKRRRKTFRHHHQNYFSVFICFFEHFRQVFSFVWFLVPFVCVCVCAVCVCVCTRRLRAVCRSGFLKRKKWRKNWRDKKEKKEKKIRIRRFFSTPARSSCAGERMHSLLFLDFQRERRDISNDEKYVFFFSCLGNFKIKQKREKT